MDKQALIERLTSLPEMIHGAEKAVYNLTMDVQTAKEKVEAREAELLAGGTIDGKNAETRKAQLFQQTEPERAALREAERLQANARMVLTRHQNEFAALRSVALLMADMKGA